MKIEVDIERLVSRSIIDGILNTNNIQEEVGNILRSDEYQKILSGHIKTRLDELLFTEDGKKLVDKSIIDGIVDSENIQNEIEKILEGDEYQKILQKEIKTCLQEVIFSEEGKKQISIMVKEFLKNYDIEYDDDFNEELNKGVSDVLLMMMKESFQRLKMSNTYMKIEK
jgi:tRNA nucleotidyltransferase/poly(A) polymerase